MTNTRLEIDYVRRAGHRLAALQVLLDRDSHADVIREAQEIVELSLKALLRASGISTPQIHDVGPIVVRERERLPQEIRGDAERMAEISKGLRKDREIAFYGAEDLVRSSTGARRPKRRSPMRAGSMPGLQAWSSQPRKRGTGKEGTPEGRASPTARERLPESDSSDSCFSDL